MVPSIADDILHLPVRVAVSHNSGMAQAKGTVRFYVQELWWDIILADPGHPRCLKNSFWSSLCWFFAREEKSSKKKKKS
jgi:hypothetical protein